MTAARRRALLGDDVIDHINAEADAAIEEHPPSEELLGRLRPILSRPSLTEAIERDRSAA